MTDIVLAGPTLVISCLWSFYYHSDGQMISKSLQPRNHSCFAASDGIIYSWLVNEVVRKTKSFSLKHSLE